MTPSEAAAILGVGEDVAIDDLRRRYETLHNDYQIRLTNAPTAALKKTYQQKLQELVTAASALHPSFAAAVRNADLPSAEPTLDADEIMDNPPRRSSAPPDTRTGARSVAGSVPTPAAASGFPPSTMIAGTVAAVLAGALSLAVLKWTQAATETGKLRAAAVGLQASSDASARLIFNDRLRVQNLSKNSIRIVAAAFVYRDQSGVFKVAHSGNAGYPEWDIKPGATVQLDSEMGRGRVWDGPVTYYSLLLDYPAVEPVLRAGLWAEDIDRDKVIPLDLD
jgi:hypothetical protein